MEGGKRQDDGGRRKEAAQKKNHSTRGYVHGHVGTRTVTPVHSQSRVYADGQTRSSHGHVSTVTVT